jgi:outer membrane protein assembly factor BamE (lipoprotein component of BamABCDE complex)
MKGNHTMYKKITNLCLFLIFMTICSCAQFSYKSNVSQGFIPDLAKINNITVDMSSNQVIALIGEPTIKNTFYPNKWSYVEIIDLGDENITTKTLTLTFTGDKLTKIDKAI